jgi:pilus assembly protein CpaB
MTRRIGLLAAALVVALLGTMAVFSYVNKVEANTLAGAEPVDVLVATQRIPSGTTASAAMQQKLVEVSSLPRKSVPEGALATLDGVGEQTLVSDVFAGEVLLRAKFATQTARTGALLIPKDKIAISVQLGDPQRVAGFVVPGSEVAIFATVEKAPATTRTTQATPAQPQEEGSFTRLLLGRVAVIAVGPATLRPVAEGEAAAEAVPTAVLTLAVTQSEAERLVHSTQTAELYFGLLSTTSKTGPSSGVSNSTLFQVIGTSR